MIYSLNIYDLFCRQVDFAPTQVAVFDGHTSTSYEELRYTSLRVSAALRAKGCRPGDIVAIAMMRDAMSIAAMLAVLGSGSIYLPLDPQQPSMRLEGIVATAKARFVVGEEAHLTSLSIPGAVKLTTSEITATESTKSGEAVIPPDGLAYLLFTSGSTGTPKGAMNTHRALSALTDAIGHLWARTMDGPARVAVVAPFVFDASLQQIISALLLGHTLCIVPEEIRRDGHALVRYLVEHSIEATDGTPSLLRLLTEGMKNQTEFRPRTSQYLIGGEELLSEVVAEFLSVHPKPTPMVTNMYGVTECGVDSIVHTVVEADLRSESSIPIGRPITGTIIRIFDETLNEVATGTPGEICISGIGVGTGYIGDKSLTEKKFVEVPDAPGVVFYRTGDVGIIDQSGTIRYMGRRDRQIKLHGHRIELGEIEAAISRFGMPSHTDTRRCIRCVLTSDFPGASIGNDGLCAICRDFAIIEPNVNSYFRDRADLDRLIEHARMMSDSPYDCLLLYSGGKDSTYALCKLVETGTRVLAYTFNNGFISESALTNAQRMTAALGVEHRIGTIDNMISVFRVSLVRESTVCAGCFRGLTVQSTRLAEELGIRIVVTGLSRGQIFDTKLKRLYQAGITDVADIEKRLRAHRAYYHSSRDPITRELKLSNPTASALSEIEFIDYFRYDDATTDGIRSALDERQSIWQTPTDTGMCSTNCRINNVGIYVHNMEHGFHNYIEPIAWDCRLSVMSRQEALLELSHFPETDDVADMLREIKYEPRERSRICEVAVVVRRGPRGTPFLAAFYVASGRTDPNILRAYLRRILPLYMVPSVIVPLKTLPTTPIGKVDHRMLETIKIDTLPDATEEPMTDTEERVRRVWCDVLECDDVDLHTEFSAYGGDSLMAVTLLVALEADFTVTLTVSDVFASPTVTGMARLIDDQIAHPKSVESRLIAVRAKTLRRVEAGQPHIVLFPGVLDNLDVFEELVSSLPEGIGVYGMLLPGLHSGLARDMEHLLDELATVVRDLNIGGPLMLLGWSLGGTIAALLARYLEQSDRSVVAVMALEAHAPDARLWREELTYARAFLRKIGTDPDTRTWRELAEVARNCYSALHGVPEFVQRVFGAFRSIGASEIAKYIRYVPSAIEVMLSSNMKVDMHCPVHVIRVESSDVTMEEWIKLGANVIACNPVQGDHHSILSVGVDQIATLVVEIIRQEVNKS